MIRIITPELPANIALMPPVLTANQKRLSTYQQIALRCNLLFNFPGLVYERYTGFSSRHAVKNSYDFALHKLNSLPHLPPPFLMLVSFDVMTGPGHLSD